MTGMLIKSFSIETPFNIHTFCDFVFLRYVWAHRPCRTPQRPNQCDAEMEVHLPPSNILHYHHTTDQDHRQNHTRETDVPGQGENTDRDTTDGQRPSDHTSAHCFWGDAMPKTQHFHSGWLFKGVIIIRIWKIQCIIYRYWNNCPLWVTTRCRFYQNYWVF